MRIESSQVSYEPSHRSENTTVSIDETVRSSNAVPVDTVALSDVTDLSNPKSMAELIIEFLLKGKVQRLALGSKHAARSAPSNGGGEVHRRTEMHSEAERTSFEARGVVETADGRSIRFSVKLDMERSFQSVTSTTGAANATDPLVVNLGGGPARLAGAKVAFDLNSDGNEESISFVADGSGFLALDGNGDGKVNDGQELFGPQTGNGFGELAAYDADGNGWIDEGDPVFAKLRIWTSGGLSTLTEEGIGAIATSAVETPFALKDSAGVLEAEIRASGVYLAENGGAGSIQQVDLAQA